MKVVACAVIALLSLCGCATQLTPQGERVRLVNEGQRSSCKFIKLITVQADLGPDKSGSALKKALNQAGDAGADSFYIVTNNIHWLDGASVAGEALRCSS